MIVREWIIRLGLIAFGFIIGVIALEFGLSRFAPNPRTFKADYYYEPNRYIGWKGIPNFKGEFKKGRVESYVMMNAHGFRDKERTYEKKWDTFRIVVLGDSYTEGVQVPLEMTFPYLLEEKLNSEKSGKKFEVLNLGVSGFGTGQEYRMLQHYGLEYKPDLVILAFFIGNDVSDNSFAFLVNPYRPYFVLNNGELEEIPFKMASKEEEQTKRGADRLLTKFFPNIYSSLSENSYYSSSAIDYIRDRINRTTWLGNFLWKLGVKKSKPESPEEYVQNRIPLNDYVYVEKYPPNRIGLGWQYAWEVTKSLILRISWVLKEKNIGFLVVVIPEGDKLLSDSWKKEYAKVKTLKFDVEQPERILSEFFGQNNIDYLLLRPELKKYTESGKRLYFPYTYECHFNANGHALAAESIYKKLKDSNVVPQKGGHV